MLVFDTNQLRHVLPGKPALPMMKAAANRTGHTLAITDIVCREVVRQRREDLKSRIKKVRAAIDDLNGLLPAGRRIPDPLEPFGFTPRDAKAVDQQVEAFRAALSKDFQILVTDGKDALEALFREADRKAPCKPSGEGGRDTAIFLTAVRAAADPDRDPDSGAALPLIFVSGDKAFAAPGDPNQPAPDLLADIGDRDVVICPDVFSALTRMGFPSTQVDPAPIIESEDFRKWLRAAILAESGPLLNPVDIEAVNGAAEVTLPQLVERGKWGRQCSGDGLTMTSVEGRWSFKVITLKQPSPLVDDLGFEVSADLTLLIVQDAAGNLLGLQLSPMTISAPL